MNTPDRKESRHSWHFSLIWTHFLMVSMIIIYISVKITNTAYWRTVCWGVYQGLSARCLPILKWIFVLDQVFLHFYSQGLAGGYDVCIYMKCPEKAGNSVWFSCQLLSEEVLFCTYIFSGISVHRGLWGRHIARGRLVCWEGTRQDLLMVSIARLLGLSVWKGRV